MIDILSVKNTKFYRGLRMFTLRVDAKLLHTDIFNNNTNGSIYYDVKFLWIYFFENLRLINNIKQNTILIE